MAEKLVLKQVVRNDIDVKFPADLTWSGLDSLLAETKRTTFGISVSADSAQSVVGPDGHGQIRVRSNHPASFRFTIAPVGGGATLISDSVARTTAGVLTFPTMRAERPLCASMRKAISGRVMSCRSRVVFRIRLASP